MSKKRFKIGEPVKVVSIKKDAPAYTIGMTGKICVIEKEGSRFDYCVCFTDYKGKEATFYYDDGDLEPADAVTETKPGMVKVEIEIPVIPEDKIPAGMKMGKHPFLYCKREKGNTILLSVNIWAVCNSYTAGSWGIVANFVPIEPEEKEFIDKERYSVCGQWYVADYKLTGYPLTAIASHTLFVEYLWLDADGKIIYSDVHFFRTKKHGVCTHVRFINPKYKKGE